MRVLLVVCAFLMSYSAARADYSFYWTWWPYGNAFFPSDPSRNVFGSTPEEVCAQRTEYELTYPSTATPVYLGMLPNTTQCGYQWLNGPYLISNPDFSPSLSFCSQTV